MYRNHDYANEVHVITHPLVQQKLVFARDARTGSDDFRRLLREIAMLMAFEITRDCPTRSATVRTPLASAEGAVLAREITLVPILRAGLGMADGVLQLVPGAHVVHLGIYRDETSLQPVVYYNRLAPRVARTEVIVVDPMLATGGSCCVAIDAIKQAGARQIKLLCLVASPEGIGQLGCSHPDVAIYTAAIDERLNDKGYILPGLGDAGDRCFGTE
ncbi:MAG TPA: uracil phosphoribosyltransferase [Phycisphaerae bacterium]|nr:uracil phosphoribosyltransferase [Phycisphaerae bacterium]